MFPTCFKPHKGNIKLNSFEAGGDGGGPSEWDNQYHSDDEPVVALSTGRLHVITTLWMPLKQFGKPWECLKVSGVEWTFTGLMLMTDFHVSTSS
ncbi:hypothetical protein PTKIN_Ptkin14bG0165500 [Pterospermum kingtungense]